MPYKCVVDGGAGQPAGTEQLDDGGVQRLAVVLVPLADVDPHQGAFPNQAVHLVPPRPSA